MPLDVRYDVPFQPQQSMTEQVLAALQLGHTIRQQREELALRQQQVNQQGALIPSDIAQRNAAAGQAQAETAALPQRLALQKQQIDAETELRKATLDVESKRWMGMLGVQQDKEALAERQAAFNNELNATKSFWQTKKDQADIAGTQGRLQLGKDALAEKTRLDQQETQLRQMGLELQAQGQTTRAQAMISEADAIANKVGFFRNFLGDIGVMPPAEIPPAAQGKTPSAQPAAPPAAPAAPGAPTIFKYDNQGNRL